MKLAVLLLAACAHAEPPPPKTLQLNISGAPVDVERALPAGYVSVVDFWATWCEACKKWEAALDTAIANQPRIVVRKVDVGEGGTPVARMYGISNLPHMRIYDRGRHLRYDLVGPDCERAGEYALGLARE